MFWAPSILKEIAATGPALGTVPTRSWIMGMDAVIRIEPGRGHVGEDFGPARE